MAKRAVIFGTDACPYTTAACEEYAGKGYEVDYVNVESFPERLPELLELSGGRREQPVIQVDGEVRVGFGGT